MKTFLQKFIDGEANSNEINDYVDEWHEEFEDGVELYEFLGFTKEEYKSWAEDPDYNLHDILSNARRKSKMDGIISPNCCDEVSKNNTVTIFINEYDHEGSDYKDAEPEWTVYNLWSNPALSGFPPKHFTNTPVKFCPHCAEKLPKIVKKSNPPKVRLNGDGNYCDTCNERLSSCICLSPVYLWKIEGEEG
jgi:hypothetical protein